MEITELEAVPLALPFREPYVTASGRLDSREMILIRLHTDEGVVGLGEVTPLSLRGGTSLEKSWRQLHKAGHRLSRTSLDGIAGPDPLAAAIEVVVAQVPGRRYAEPVKAGLEMALFDLAAKIAGQPLWQLMKAPSAEPVRCNATLSSGEAVDVAQRAEAWAARGFETFKLKVGAGDDLAQVAAVRSAVGPDARIRVDANASWSADEAIESLAAIEAQDVELAEQPARSLRELARVSEASRIPVAADESVNDAKDAARAAETRACRYATVKLAKVGGIGPASSIARELPVYLSSALDGPVGIAAAAHTAQAIYRNAEDPGLAHGLATQALFERSIAATECVLERDRLTVPAGNGLGVEIDEAALEGLAL
jgi:o-succinylbenzoate synthase